MCFGAYFDLTVNIKARFYKDGKWHVVTVDDRFPCNQKKKFAYSRAIKKQLW